MPESVNFRPLSESICLHVAFKMAVFYFTNLAYASKTNFTTANPWVRNPNAIALPFFPLSLPLRWPPFLEFSSFCALV
jgi:hypothetical protein